MAIPTITNGQLHCFPFTYEGNGGGQRVGNFVPFTDNGTIANSCIFNRADNATMTRTPSSAGTRTKFTVSVWVKLSSNFGTRRFIFYGAASGNNFAGIEISSNDRFRMYASDGSGAQVDLDLESTRTLEDTSKWYHLLAVFDSTQSSASDRAKMYIDGDQVTDFATNTNNLVQDFEFQGTNNVLNVVGGWDSSLGGSPATYAFDGYMAEMNLVDGSALTPSTFGLTDTSTGRWIPKTLTGITYGTNGFRLQHATNSNLGDDTSGNVQDFTLNNLASTDQTTDSPTQNYPIFDPLRQTSYTYSEGNLDLTTSTNSRHALSNRLLPKSGKWYWEVQIKNKSSGSSGCGLAFDTWSTTDSGATAEGLRIIFTAGTASDGKVYETYSSTQYTSSQLTTFAADDYIGFAYDADTGKIWISKNGSYINSGNPVTGAGHVLTAPNSFDWRHVTTGYNNNSTQRHIWNFGQRSFNTAAPTGFKDLNQDNLPETSRGKPDFTFIKDFDSTVDWHSYDSSRGAGYYMLPSTSGAETYVADSLQKFLKGGFSVEDNTSVNKVSSSVVAWNWVANNGVTGANTDGSGSALSCNYQTNQDAGFSIVTFQGNGGHVAVEHGLSQAPEFIIQRQRDNGGSNWWCYTTKFTIGSYHYNKLDTNTSWSSYGQTQPTNKVFTSHGWGSDNIIAYCWHSVPGFSYFGSYIGDANADGPYIHLDFKPAIVWLKSNNSANWYVYDIARSPKNPADERLVFTTAAQSTNANRGIDICASGFKVRQESGYGYNYSGVDTFVAAWAEHPFLGSGSKSPLTAR